MKSSRTPPGSYQVGTALSPPEVSGARFPKNGLRRGLRILCFIRQKWYYWGSYYLVGLSSIASHKGLSQEGAKGKGGCKLLVRDLCFVPLEP